MLLVDTIFRIMARRVPFFIRPVLAAVFGKARSGFTNPRIDALLRKAESDLAHTPWLGGDDLTAADIVISYPMESASMRGYFTDAHPNCRAWLERVYGHPSFKVAKEKDGKPTMVLPI